MRSRSEAGDLSGVRDDFLEPVGTERPKADGCGAIDAT